MVRKQRNVSGNLELVEWLTNRDIMDEADTGVYDLDSYV